MTIDFSKPLTEITFPVDERTEGLRVDAALAKLLPHRSRTFFQKRARDGAVTVNGRRAKARTELREGDTIRLEVDISPSWVDPLSIDVEILMEREDLVAVNKHPGQIIHPVGAVQGGTLINALHARHNTSGQDPVSRPCVVHRLDADTSGVVVFAKGSAPAGHYGQLFETRKTRKEYLAILDGELPEPVDCREPLGDDVDHPVHVRHGVRADGKPARSVFHPLATDGHQTLVRVEIHTGRLHQIRIHAAHIGHPVAGDALYNPTDEDFDRWIRLTPPRIREGRPRRQLLHAWRLRLQSPEGEELAFEAPIPGDFREFAPELTNVID